MPAGRENRQGEGTGSSKAAHMRTAHALSYLLAASVIRAVAITVYPLYR